MASFSTAVMRGLHADRPSAGPVGNAGRLYYATDTFILWRDSGSTWESVEADLSGYQPLDSDLTAIAALTATTDRFLQSKASAWTTRTPTQVTADLIAMVGDSGSGGTKGLVPAPASGDAAAAKFLKADGTWDAPSGTGAPTTAHYVTTQAEAGLSAESNLGALTTGMLKHTVSGSVSTPATAAAGTDYAGPPDGSTLETNSGNTRIKDSGVTLAKLANIADATILGNNTGGAAAPVALTASQIRTLLALVIGTNVQAWDADLDTWATKTAPSGAAVGTTDTQTLTNKRVTARTGTTTSSGTPTINTDNVDFYSITALAAAITSFTSNLSGTPTEGQKLWIAITDNGTARAITWGASFEASGGTALPTTTVISTRLDVGFIWNSVTSKWRCVGSA